MHLLEQALQIGMRELEALNSGEVEQAAVWEEERSRLTQQAMECNGDTPLDALRVELQKLCDMQKRLTEAGHALRRSWQKDVMRVRGENRRLAGYRQAITHALQQ